MVVGMIVEVGSTKDSGGDLRFDGFKGRYTAPFFAESVASDTGGANEEPGESGGSVTAIKKCRSRVVLDKRYTISTMWHL